MEFNKIASMKIKRYCFSVQVFFFSIGCYVPHVSAENVEQEWGIAAVMRTATVPYDIPKGDNLVGTFIPMLYFQNEHLYIDGTEAGAYLFESYQEPYQWSAIARMRFLDLPKEHQNKVEGDTADFGIQLRHQSSDESWYTEVELMMDDGYRFHGNLRVGQQYESGALEFEPTLTLRYKDADFNTYYYSLKTSNLGAGIDIKASLDAKYHVVSNLYLLGGAGLTVLDNNAYQSDIIDERVQGEIFLGFGFFNEKGAPKKTNISNRPYLRVAHGWATPSNMGDILSLETEKDENNNQLSSLFYGHLSIYISRRVSCITGHRACRVVVRNMSALLKRTIPSHGRSGGDLVLQKDSLTSTTSRILKSMS